MDLVKTAVADDHPVVIEGIKHLLAGFEALDFDLACATGSGAELARTVQSGGIDLVIMDLNLSELDGLQTIKAIRDLDPDIALLVYSRFEDPRLVQRAIHAGATGFLLKQDGKEEFFRALQVILIEEKSYRSPSLSRKRNGARGSRWENLVAREEAAVKPYRLTKREAQVLRLISQAMSNKEIAQELFISDQTVGVHRKNIMRKLGVSNTAGLIKVAYEQHLI